LLGSSEVQKLYVPVEDLQPFCDDLACAFVATDEEKRRQRENEDREQRRLREEKEKARKRFMIMSSSIGGTVLGLVVLIWLATRPVLQRLFVRFRLRLGEIIAGQERGHYRAVPLHDPQGHSSALDERVGMNRYD
jgi:hypothetical protein